VNTDAAFNQATGEAADGNKSLYLVFVGVIFSQHLGLLLEQLGQHLGLLLEQLG
jgi:hypothetical protein